MPYHENGSPISDEGWADCLNLFDVPPAILWAILRVETNGFGFLPSRRPVIRYEQHVFHRLTEGKYDLEYPGISNPVPGGYVGGAAEYSRLDAASALDREAAVQSTSWGVGQLMGFNWTDTGYKSAVGMAEGMARDEDEQLFALVRFMGDESLDYCLNDHDWEEFAKRYNGAGYARNQYDVKLEAAVQLYEKTLPDLDIRAAQACLTYLGYPPGPVDGFLGPRTRAAVIAFQRARKYHVTGKMSAWLIETLFSAAFDGESVDPRDVRRRK